MPFIRRSIKAEAPSILAIHAHQLEHYVKATHVQKGDVVIPPSEIDDVVLADLAITHPKEFRAAALARGLVRLETNADDDEEGDVDDEAEEESWSPAQEAFLTANAAAAVALVKAAALAEHIDLLAQYAEAEESKTPPRKSVLQALADAITE